MSGPACVPDARTWVAPNSSSGCSPALATPAAAAAGVPAAAGPAMAGAYDGAASRVLWSPGTGAGGGTAMAPAAGATGAATGAGTASAPNPGIAEMTPEGCGAASTGRPRADAVLARPVPQSRRARRCPPARRPTARTVRRWSAGRGPVPRPARGCGPPCRASPGACGCRSQTLDDSISTGPTTAGPAR